MQDTIIANVVNVRNMTKIWNWLLDGKLQNVNSEDLHDQAKELHRPEDCGRATYSRPRSLAAAGPPASGKGPALCLERRMKNLENLLLHMLQMDMVS